MITEDENIWYVEAGKRFVVADRESGSKGIMPIIVDNGFQTQIVKADKGIIRNREDNERVCDYILVVKSKSEKIVCMTELKGTNLKDEISRAYTQISQTIKRAPAEYLNDSDFLVAAVAGAPDKTLPSMIDNNRRELCKRLLSKNKQKERIKDMNKLVFYVQPNDRIKKAYINTRKVPRVIECHSRNGAEIPTPSMLVEAVTK